MKCILYIRLLPVTQLKQITARQHQCFIIRFLIKNCLPSVHVFILVWIRLVWTIT